MVGLENKINTLMTYLTTTHDMPWKQNKYFNVVHCISVKNMIGLENKISTLMSYTVSVKNMIGSENKISTLMLYIVSLSKTW
jgi:hypothetical protein